MWVSGSKWTWGHWRVDNRKLGLMKSLGSLFREERKLLSMSSVQRQGEKRNTEENEDIGKDQDRGTVGKNV